MGYPKCFSTSLQKAFFEKHPEITYGGIGVGDHLSFANSGLEFVFQSLLQHANKPYFERNFKEAKKIVDEFVNSASDTTVFSLETLVFPFSSLDFETITERIKLLFEGYDIHVLLVIREQLGFLKSLYGEFLRMGYPEIVKPILQTENQWSKKAGGINLRFNYPRAQGKYIALCDGDDFWIGKDKLQKQVDILENNTECSLTNGAYLMIRKGKDDVLFQNKLKTENQDRNGGFFELEDVTNKFSIKASTVLFRNLPDLVDQFKRYEFSFDIHLFYLLLKNGKGYYSNEVMAGYNKHQGGVYSGGASEEILLTQYLILKDIYEKDKDEFIRKKYLNLAGLMISLKISGLMQDKRITQSALRERNPGILEIIKVIKPRLKTKSEQRDLYKNLIPIQVKLLKQKIKRVLSN